MTTKESSKVPRILEEENLLKLISRYFDLRSFACFASVSRRTFPLSVPAYLSTSSEYIYEVCSMILCHSPTYTLRCFSSLGDLMVIHCLERNNLQSLEESLKDYSITLSSSCMQVALERVSSDFEFLSFFTLRSRYFDLRLLRYVFSDVTDRYFPLDDKHRAFQSLLDEMNTGDRDIDALTVNKLLFASSSIFAESADQTKIFDSFCYHYFHHHEKTTTEVLDNLQLVLAKIDQSRQPELCRQVIKNCGVGMPRPMLEFLISIAISEGPIHFAVYTRFAEMIQEETCHFILSLPHEKIFNRPQLLNKLLEKAPPAVVHILLAVPMREIADRADALNYRLDYSPSMSEEERELHRSLLCLPSAEIEDFCGRLGTYFIRASLYWSLMGSEPEPESYPELEKLLKLPIQEEDRQKALKGLLEMAFTREAQRLTERLLQEECISKADICRMLRHKPTEMIKWLQHSDAERSLSDILEDRLRSTFDSLKRSYLTEYLRRRENLSSDLSDVDGEEYCKFLWWIRSANGGPFVYRDQSCMELRREDLEVFQTLIQLGAEHIVDCETILAEFLQTASELELIKILLELPSERIENRREAINHLLQHCAGRAEDEFARLLTLPFVQKDIGCQGFAEDKEQIIQRAFCDYNENKDSVIRYVTQQLGFQENGSSNNAK